MPSSSAFHKGAPCPARVLADCAAKRQIVEAFEAWENNAETYSPDYWAAPMPLVLGLLALPYADHESFDESWRP
jgi:hypothetical protein